MHLGHHGNPPDASDQVVDVEVHLERDIATVQDATDAFLGDPGDASRAGLLAALEALDQRTSASDSFEDGIVGSAVFGTSSKGSVIGETSLNPMAEELPGSVLRAQVALVRAAKDAVTSPGTTTLESLRSASEALAALRPPEQADDGKQLPPGDPR